MDFSAVLTEYVRTPAGYAQIADWGGNGFAAAVLSETRHHGPAASEYGNANVGRSLRNWAQGY